MPFKRRTFKKPVRKLAPVQKKAVSKMINKALDTRIEDKYVVQGGPVSPSSVGTIFTFGNPTIGTGVNDRIGNVIHSKRIKARFTVINGTTAGVGEINDCRIMVLQWKAVSPNAPTIPEILTLNGGFMDSTSLYVNTMSSSFNVLYDRVFTVNPTDGPKHFSINLSKYIHKISYNSGTTAGYNNFFMLLWSDSSVLNHPIFNFTLKHYFEDA